VEPFSLPDRGLNAFGFNKKAAFADVFLKCSLDWEPFAFELGLDCGGIMEKDLGTAVSYHGSGAGVAAKEAVGRRNKENEQMSRPNIASWIRFVFENRIGCHM
jgi:hypothetical protein